MNGNVLRLFKSRVPNLAANLKSRRITIFSLIVSSTFIVFCTFFLKDSFKIVLSDIAVRIEPHTDSVKLKNAHITLYKGVKSDTLSIDATFSLDNHIKDGKIIIFVPEGLILDTSSLHGLTFVESQVWPSEQLFTYSVTADRADPSLYLSFKGRIFPRVRELFLSLTVMAGRYFNDHREHPPVRLTFEGLGLSDITYLSNQPQSRSAYTIDYDPLEYASSGSLVGPIEMKILDRDVGYLSEYKMFISGILLGVFASFFASIMWSIIQEYETLVTSKTQQTGQRRRRRAVFLRAKFIGRRWLP